MDCFPRHSAPRGNAALIAVFVRYPSNGTIGLGLGKPLTKKDIPVGTEIWKVG